MLFKVICGHFNHDSTLVGMTRIVRSHDCISRIQAALLCSKQKSKSCKQVGWIYCLCVSVSNLAIIFNPNTIKSYKILQKLSPKHAAHGVAQSTYPIYRHGKACMSKQPSWHAAGDPRLARGRSQVRAPGPVGALRSHFLHPPFLPPSGDSFFCTFPTNPAKVLGLIKIMWTTAEDTLCVFCIKLSHYVDQNHINCSTWWWFFWGACPDSRACNTYNLFKNEQTQVLDNTEYYSDSCTADM